MTGSLAVRDATRSLDQIIAQLDKAVDARIALTPALVRDLRDLLVMVRDCAVNLAAAELSLVPDAIEEHNRQAAKVVAFPGRDI